MRRDSSFVVIVVSEPNHGFTVVDAHLKVSIRMQSPGASEVNNRLHKLYRYMNFPSRAQVTSLYRAVVPNNRDTYLQCEFEQ